MLNIVILCCLKENIILLNSYLFIVDVFIVN